MLGIGIALIVQPDALEATGFDTDVSSPTFGQWNGNVSTPRNIQFAMKILF